MPENGFAADFYHGFWLNAGFFGKARAHPSCKDDNLHFIFSFLPFYLCLSPRVSKQKTTCTIPPCLVDREQYLLHCFGASFIRELMPDSIICVVYKTRALLSILDIPVSSMENLSLSD